jgi:hypothetical protein
MMVQALCREFRQPCVEQPHPDAAPLPVRQHVDSRELDRLRRSAHELRESDDIVTRFRDEEARSLRRERATEALPYAGSPTPMLQLVNAFKGETDTRGVAEWDFTPEKVHLVGIRRNEMSNKFDDIFVLLLKGLVFKFQGTTEPGASDNPAGTPFLVQGQHDYHFGWHKRQYLALRPERVNKGVLVVRSKGDIRLDEADLANGLEANGSINVHWGGKGMKFDVKTWSEGCQVITGSVYLNEKNELIDGSAFVATNNGEVTSNRAKTRGAYNVLLDLVTALGSDLASNSVKYTLLTEDDLDLSPALEQGLAGARAKAGQLLG